MKVPQAIVLLGGQGTRLRPFTLKKPKPLLPLLNRPMFFFQLEQLKQAGVREVILALGHGARHFRRHLGEGRRGGVKLRYSVETSPLGTGGAIGLAGRFVDGPAFVLNGDILGDIDLGALARLHFSKKAEATLALTPVEDPSAFGVAEAARDGRIVSFVEKPAPGTEPSNLINAGVYLFSQSVFQAIPAGRPVSVERETFPALLAEGRRVYGFLHRGDWSDVGTLRAYHRAHADMLARYGAWDRKFRLGRKIAAGARVHRTARLSGQVLMGPGARVEAGAVLEGFVCLGPGAVVGAGSRVKDSVVHVGARLGRECRVEGALVGEGVRMGDFCAAGPGAVLGPGSRWSAHSRSGAPESQTLKTTPKRGKLPR